MADRIVEIIENSDGRERIFVVQRLDGCYSFRLQAKKNSNYSGPGHFVWPDGYPEELGWWPPGPYVGIYDSPETAKWEALGKVDWVASTIRPH